MNRLPGLHASLALLAIFLGGTASAQNLVQNGGFETPAVPGWGTTVASGGTALSPWVVSGGGVDLVHPTSLSDAIEFCVGP